MAGKITLFVLLTIGIIAFDWFRKRDTKKSAIAAAIFIYIIAVGYSGAILTRPIVPLFIIHLITLIVAYAGLMIYIFKKSFKWYLFIAPILTFALAFGLNFFDGSRYES